MVIEQHKHCPICGKPMPLSEKFCSDQCEEVYILRQQKINKQRKMLYGIIAVFVIVWLVVMFMKKG